MADITESDLTSRLRRLVETVDIANLLTEPLTSSLEYLLRTSSAELDSAEASVLVREADTGDLRFLVATGSVADQLIGMTVPAGKGIAGFVLVSGQPMAVSDVGEESTFYAEVDKHTGYKTETILAVPLRFQDEIIGVLEYINRTGSSAGAPFTPDEMDRAGVYANAVASLVNAYEASRLIRNLSNRSLAEANESDLSAVRGWLAELRESPEHKERLDLALLVRELASRGDAERRLCKEMLEAVIRFSDGSSSTSYLNYKPE